jgi:hypothetical protein
MRLLEALCTNTQKSWHWMFCSTYTFLHSNRLTNSQQGPQYHTVKFPYTRNYYRASSQRVSLSIHVFSIRRARCVWYRTMLLWRLSKCVKTVCDIFWNKTFIPWIFFVFINIDPPNPTIIFRTVFLFELSFETPACQDISLLAEESQLSRVPDLAIAVENWECRHSKVTEKNSKKLIRLRKEDFMLCCSYSKTVMNPLPGYD